MTARSIELWTEFASTYSYPAVLRAQDLADRAGLSLVWRPFLLGPIFAHYGWTDSPFKIHPEKGRYMWRDLERICAAGGVDFRRPSVFPRGSLLATRVACWHDSAAWLGAFVREVMLANFRDDRDIGSVEIVSACLEAVGVDARTALEAGTTEAAKAKLRARGEEALRRGLFGAPTCFVGEELFWGNDRLEAAIAWAQT